MIWSYGAILIIALFGKSFIDKISSSKIALASLSGSTIFYLISNFGVWALGSPGVSNLPYDKTLSGLIECYVFAIPFFPNTFLSTLIFLPLISSFFIFLSKDKNALSLGISLEL